MQNLVIVFMTCCIFSCSSLGWHDVCNMTETSHTCYIWPNNPSPYNKIESFVQPGSVCDNTCILYLSSAARACTNFTDCSTVTSGTVSHEVAATLNILSKSISILSHDDNTISKIIFQDNMNVPCTIFNIHSNSISIFNLNFEYGNNCLNDATTYNINKVPLIVSPVVIENTDSSFQINNISTNGKIATVAFLGVAGDSLDVEVYNIAFSDSVNYSFPVLFYNTNITKIHCNDASKLFYISRQRNVDYKIPMMPNCTDFMKSDYSSYYQGISINAFECKKSTVNEKKDCQKQGKTLLGLFITFLCLLIMVIIYLITENFKPGQYVHEATTKIQSKKNL